MKERESGWYWLLPFHTTFWEVVYFDANWQEWHYRGNWGWMDKDFEEIGNVKLIRDARQENH